MILVRNLLQQLNGSKQFLLFILVAFTIQSCSVFEDIFGSKTPPPPPPPIEEKPTQPSNEVEKRPENKEPEVTDTIIIPEPPKPPVIEKEQITIAVMLPFQLDKMDATNRFSSAARNSFELYKGIQFALQDANFIDKELNVYVLDNAGNDSKTLSQLQQHPFPDVDVVIGPLYTKSMKIVANYAKENKIPFISPLSSSENLASGNNGYVLSANATSTTRYEILFDFIEKEFVNPNIGIIYQPIKKEERVKNQLLSVANQQGIDVKEQLSEGREMFTSVESLLEKGRENVIITSVDDNEEGKLYFTRLLTYLNQIGGDYTIKLMATREWNDVKSILPSQYPNVSLYILDRFLDPTNSPNSQTFEQLRYKNNNKPLHIYSLQGYDLMSYLISLMEKHGKDFEQYITKEEYQGLQTKYQFDRFSTAKGFAFYDNKHINILHYQNGAWQRVN